LLRWPHGWSSSVQMCQAYTIFWEEVNTCTFRIRKVRDLTSKLHIMFVTVDHKYHIIHNYAPNVSFIPNVTL
jgi:hypothetical protein